MVVFKDHKEDFCNSEDYSTWPMVKALLAVLMILLVHCFLRIGKCWGLMWDVHHSHIHVNTWLSLESLYNLLGGRVLLMGLQERALSFWNPAPLPVRPLLSRFRYNVVSNLQLLLPCLPHHDGPHPLELQRNPSSPKLLLVMYFVTTMRKEAKAMPSTYLGILPARLSPDEVPWLWPFTSVSHNKAIFIKLTPLCYHLW